MYSIMWWVKPYLMALKLTVEENVVLATLTKLNFIESNINLTYPTEFINVSKYVSLSK